MKTSLVASRYAKALFELAVETKNIEPVFSNLRDVSELVQKDAELMTFFKTPLISTEDKEASLKKALENAKLTSEVQALLMLLAQKNRLDLFFEIVDAYQQESDDKHGVVRGTVRSAGVLSPEDRSQIESIVGKVTNKQVILNYKEDSSVIGGLIADVGSYTFDDTLSSHLRRIKEEINRRSH